MWVWTRPEPSAVIGFAQQNHVRRLFVSVPAHPDTRYRAWARQLGDRAHAAHVSLWALGGDSSWVAHPDRAVAWQRDALALGVFAGAHVDAEPHQLPAWSKPSARPALAAQHVALVAKMQAASPRPLEVDLPFWAGQIRVGSSTWADQVLVRADLVTAMTYRDNAAGILAVGEDLLHRGDRARKPVQLAAETDPLADCSYCTFWEEGGRALTTSVSVVEQRARTHASFAGVAVHRYARWSELARR